MPDSVLNSAVAQAVLDGIIEVLAPYGVGPDNVYLVDEDDPPDTSLAFAIQVREDDSGQRHARSGVGLYDGAFSVTIWTQTLVDPGTQATIRVKQAQDMAQLVREYLNGNWLNNAVVIPVTMTQRGQLRGVADAQGWVKSTDLFAYASYFVWKNNGTVPVG